MLLFASCEVLEFNSRLETPFGTDLIEGPDTTPADEGLFIAFLHGATSKVWSAQGFTIAGLSGFQDCRLDDTIELFANGSYSYQSGTLLCGAEDNQTTRSGTWELLFEQGIIQFETGTNETFQAVIVGLDLDNIVLSSTYLGLSIEASYQTN